MATVAMIILGVLIWLFTSQKPIWQSHAKIYTYMRDSAALAKGAPVRLNGILIGNVTETELSGLKEPDKAVRVVMEVQRSRLRDIPIDSVAGISAENVLGTKYINITRGLSSQSIQAEGVLASETSAEIEDLVRKGFGLFDSAQAILNRVDKIVGQVEAGQGNVGKFLSDEQFYKELVATTTELRKLTTAIGSGKGTLGKLFTDESLYNDTSASVKRLNELLAGLQKGEGTAGQFLQNPSLYNEAKASVTELRDLIAGLNSGKGTAGKLLKDEAAYREIQRVLAKLNHTLDRVNSGQGTLGQLIVNPELYTSMEGLTTELQSLVRDVRQNPKKYLSIKLGLF
jgi:phospholipid/cholesterol/gamma-HCH transport system substrate-binding protein